MRARRALTVTAALLVLVAVTAGVTRWLASPGGAPVRIDGYLLPVDDRLPYDALRLTVRFTLGTGDTVTYARFEERDDRVVVTVRYRSAGGTGASIGKPYDLTATLEERLGSRTVVDGSSGETVARLPG